MEFQTDGPWNLILNIVYTGNLLLLLGDNKTVLQQALYHSYGSVLF